MEQQSVAAACDCAQQQSFNIKHATALLEALGEHIGEPGADRTSCKWQELGLRVEYLTRVIRGHAEALDMALADIEKAIQAPGGALRPVPLNQVRRAAR